MAGLPVPHMNLTKILKAELQEPCEFEDGTPAKEHLKRLFLRHGGLTDNNGYFLYFAFKDKDAAHDCLSAVTTNKHQNFATKKLRGRYFVYTKKAESVAEFVAFLGANKLYFNILNNTAAAGISNATNRQVNCETFNMQKRISASVSQLEAIKRLDLSKLNKQLRQTAAARLENPDATLEELAAVLGITKSGAAHRLRKIMTVKAAATD